MDRIHDFELSDRIRAGDPEALAGAYDFHAAAVYGVALRILGETCAAEDVVQEVFLDLWQRPCGYDPHRGALRPWLCGAARHKAIDELRRTARQAGVLALLTGELVPCEDAAEPFIRDVTAKAVRQALDSLPETFRTAIMMAYYGGLTYRQVAEALGIPEGTAKSRMRLGLRHLSAEDVHP